MTAQTASTVSTFLNSIYLSENAESRAHNSKGVQLPYSFLGNQQWICLVGDRTKTRNGSGNGSKNGSIKLNICSPSGRGKLELSQPWFNVTRTSMQASPPVPLFTACWVLRVNKTPIPGKLFSFPGLYPDLPWQSGNEVRPSQDNQSSVYHRT